MHEDDVYCVNFSRKVDLMFTGGYDKTLKIFSVSNNFQLVINFLIIFIIQNIGSSIMK